MAEHLVARARAEGVDLTGEGGLLTAMVREVLQTGLEVEMADHLGYEPYDPPGVGPGTTATSRSACARRSEVVHDLPYHRMDEIPGLTTLPILL